MSFNLPKTETTLQEQLHTPRQHDQTYLQYFDILTYRRRQEERKMDVEINKERRGDGETGKKKRSGDKEIYK